MNIPGTELQPRLVGLGTAELGLRQDEAAAHRLLDHFVAAGGNLVDTARIYSDWVPPEVGRSERIIGDWLRSRRREDVIISTKGGHPALDAMDRGRLDRTSLEFDIDASLRALRCETIDLYWLHRDDPTRPVGEIMESLAALHRAGKARWFGASNWTTARIAAANAYAAQAGLPRFVANQPLWCLGCATMRPLSDPTLVVLTPAEFSASHDLNLAILPYTAQANGFFTKFLSAGPAAVAENRFDTPANRVLAAVVQELAAARGCSANAIVLGYLTSHDAQILPLVGCHTPAQFDRTVADLVVQLTESEIARLTPAT